MYQDLVNEILKLFALENYIKKKREEMGTVGEVVKEKKEFLKTALGQVNNIVAQTRQQF